MCARGGALRGYIPRNTVRSGGKTMQKRAFSADGERRSRARGFALRVDGAYIRARRGFVVGVGIGLVVVVLAGLGTEVGQGGGEARLHCRGRHEAVLREVFDAGGVVDAILSEQVGHKALAFLKYGEYDMRRVHFFGFQPYALKKAEAEYLLGLFEHRGLAVAVVAQVAVHLSDGVFDAGLDFGQIRPQCKQHFHRRAIAFATDAEVDVFDTYRTVFQADSFIMAVGHSTLCVFS